MKVFGRYKGKYYYLTDMTCGISLDERDILLIYRYLGIEWNKRLTPQNRFIIYKLIRNLKSYITDRKFKNTDGIISAAAEITAEVMEIERIKEYSLQSLIYTIIEQYKVKKTDLSFEDFSKLIDDSTWNINKNNFTEKMKKAVSESKLAALYNADINDVSDAAILYRRLLAIAFPKVCIANIFIAILMNK